MLREPVMATTTTTLVAVKSTCKKHTILVMFSFYFDGADRASTLCMEAREQSSRFCCKRYSSCKLSDPRNLH